MLRANLKPLKVGERLKIEGACFLIAHAGTFRI